MKKNRGRPLPAPICVSIALHFVVVAVVVAVVPVVAAAVVAAVVAGDDVASLSAVAGTASYGLALPLSTSAPCVTAVVDAAAAGPMADADADDSSHLSPKPSRHIPYDGLS